MNQTLNCPNCGAPITGEICEYCGTVIYDFTVIDDKKPSYIKMKINGQIIMFKAFLNYASFEINHGPELYVNDEIAKSVFINNDMTVTAEFMVVPDGEVLYRIKKEDQDE